MYLFETHKTRINKTLTTEQKFIIFLKPILLLTEILLIYTH